MEEKAECNRIVMREWAMDARMEEKSDGVTLIGKHVGDDARKPFKKPKTARPVFPSMSLDAEGDSQPLHEDDKDTVSLLEDDLGTVSYLPGRNRPTLSVLEPEPKRQRCDEAPSQDAWPEFSQSSISFRC